MFQVRNLFLGKGNIRTHKLLKLNELLFMYVGIVFVVLMDIMLLLDLQMGRCTSGRRSPAR